MRNLLFILTMAFTVNVSAGDLPTIKIVEDKIFVLNINDWNNSELKVSFLNMIGEEIYSEKIAPSKMIYKEFNLQVLRKGTYQVVVSRKSGSVAYEIEVSDSGISKITGGSIETYSKGVSRDIISKIKSIY
ncbi:MAG: hypothetical protein HKN89_04125 [Eudoraea sp.]|nr:hypothetical protein [Eudoraea sp.]